MSARRRRSARVRWVGKVSLYHHHGAWWVYYREAGKPTRKKSAVDREQAEQVAAQINAQLASNAPTRTWWSS
jgi:integrase